MELNMNMKQIVEKALSNVSINGRSFKRWSKDIVDLNKLDLDNVQRVMITKKACTIRSSKHICNRKCEKCDLLLSDTDVIRAYNDVLRIIKTIKGGD